MLALTTSAGLARVAARAGTLAVVVAAAILGVLEVDAASNGMKLTRRTISHHALGINGWAFDLAVLLLACGSLAIAASLIASGVVGLRSATAVTFGLFSAGLALVAVFTKHDWSVGPSASGYVHWAGTVLAFLSLPYAVILIGRRWRHDARLRGRALWCLLLGVMSLLWFLPIVVAILVHATAGTPWWQLIPLGLVERFLAGTEFIAVLAVGFWALAAANERDGASVNLRDPAPRP